MATLQVAGAFSLRTGFGPTQIKGPSGKGWSRDMGINRRDRLSSDRRQNRPDGPAEQRLASDLTARFRHGDISVLKKEIER